MFKKILQGLVLVIVGFFIYIALQPSAFRIAREIEINAPPEVIFPFLNNAQKMNSWNPWMKLDPEVKSSYNGPEEGVGSSTTWQGNRDVGAGTATIVESVSNSRVKTHLEYKEPFEAESFAEFVLTSDGPTTKVVWSNEGHNNFFSRIVCTFMNMDKMVGGMFEKGLAELKGLAESQVSGQKAVN